MPIRITAAVAACVAATALLAPAAADAKKPAAPKLAKFKASLKGKQVLTWSHNRPQTDMCSGSESGFGSTVITYADKSATLTAFVPPKSNPAYALTGGEPLMTNDLRPAATAVRKGTHTAVPAPSPPCPAVGDGPGTGKSPERCGTRTSTYLITFNYMRKGRPSLVALPQGWAGGSDGSSLSASFDGQNCPSWVTGPYAPEQEDGTVNRFGVPLKEKTLFDRKRKTITVKASNTECFNEGGGLADCASLGQFKGKVVNTYTLKLTRR